MLYRESYYEFYDIYTNNTSYYIHENIYIYIYIYIYICMCVSIIYIYIYIKFQHYGTVFFFSSNKRIFCVSFKI